MMEENSDTAPAGAPAPASTRARVKRQRSSSRTAPTSWTVADAAGVSQSTVSRALRGDASVKLETRLRVESAAERLGYRVPSLEAARATATRTIGVVAADLTNPFFPSLLTPIHDELRLMGYRVVLFAERTDIPSGQEALSRLLDRSIDGVLVTTATLESRFMESVRGRDLPIVLLNRYVDDWDVDRSVADNYKGGRLAARHLLDLGHRRIGVIRGPSNTSTSRDRDAGFADELGEVGLQVDPALVREGSYSHQSGYQHARDLLRLEERPTAIFCGNDIIGFGAIDAARSVGIDVPSEVSIIGFDDVPMAAWEVFQLTTVRQPLADMATAAVHMLAERIERHGELDNAREQIFATSLVRRATTDRAVGS